MWFRCCFWVVDDAPYVGNKNERKVGKRYHWPGGMTPRSANSQMTATIQLLQKDTFCRLQRTRQITAAFFLRRMSPYGLTPCYLRKRRSISCNHTATTNIYSKPCEDLQKIAISHTVSAKTYAKYLVGGFNQFEKYESNWIISPGFGVKINKCLKPPTKYQWNQYVWDHSKTPIPSPTWDVSAFRSPSARQRRMLLRSTGIFWESAILYLASQSHPITPWWGGKVWTFFFEPKM